MSQQAATVRYGVYLRTWLFLLGLTTVMIVTDGLAVPRAVLVTVLLGAMLIKASLIAANFMHLRYEKRVVRVVVAASVLFFGSVLYLLIVPDGLRVLRMGH